MAAKVATYRRFVDETPFERAVRMLSGDLERPTEWDWDRFFGETQDMPASIFIRSAPDWSERIPMECAYDTPGVSDSGPVVGGDAEVGAAQSSVLPDGGVAEAERPHGS